MSHDHSHARQGRSLALSIALNLGFAVAELVAGLFANSLVLVADALHDAGDAVALSLSWLGLRLSKRPPNTRRTFGYRKVRILTAFLNALFLFAMTAFIVRAAILRIIAPEPVRSPVLIVMAVVGLAVNGAAVLLLRRDRHSLNIRAAMWHLLEDFFGWVAVLVGGIIIHFTGWYVLDPVLSLAVSAFVLWGAWSVFREATSILIDSTPKDLRFDEVRRRILEFDPAIAGVHDLHIWTLGEGERALMAHLVVPDRELSSFYPMLARLECELGEWFQIDHVTLELECDRCKSGNNVCLE
ncbi:MAG: cation diffusion facilitator family transporter [bacterium]